MYPRSRLCGDVARQAEAVFPHAESLLPQVSLNVRLHGGIPRLQKVGLPSSGNFLHTAYMYSVGL